MNLKMKMIAFVGVLMSLMTLSLGLSYYAMSGVSDALRTVSAIDLPLANSMSEVTQGQLTQSVWMERSLLAAELGDQVTLQTAESRFKEEHQRIDRAFDTAANVTSRLQQVSLSSEKTEQLTKVEQELDKLAELYDSYYGAGSDLISLLKAGEILEAEVLLKETQEISGVLTNSIDDMAAGLSASAQESSNRLLDGSETALIWMGLVGLITFLATFGLSFFITRTVLNQLGADPARLLEVAEHLANGELEINSAGNTSGVSAAISSTILKLREVIHGIKRGAEEVSVAAEQVGLGNSNLSQRTQEQASSLEEIAASMEEMTSTVNQNATNAGEANKLASDACSQAETGGRIAGEAVAAMSEINDSSKRISEIITVIDDISFQINLLALNAAVEAARAGDQGRGFAVVAGEVRNLAGRSTTAAKEIKELIQDSVSKIDNGAELVNATGNHLTEIVDSIKQVSDNVAEIAAASTEQSAGIAQVNRAILQMDEMTQQNASLVEQAAAASETVDSQARELYSLISYFKIDDGARAGGRAGLQAGRSFHEVIEAASTPKLAKREDVVVDAFNYKKRPELAAIPGTDSDDEWEQF